MQKHIRKTHKHINIHKIYKHIKNKHKYVNKTNKQKLN